MLGVATAAFICTSPGQTVVVSQFNTSFRESLGISASELGGAYMIGTMVAALPLVFVGKLSDIFGPRRTMAGVVIAFGGACWLAGQVQSLVMLTVAFFFLRFLGQGSLGLLSGHQLALWFERKLGTVNGLKVMLTQLGFSLAPALAILLIAEFGWRWAYPMLGLLVVSIMLPLIVLVARDRPEELGQRIDGDPTDEGPEHLHDDEDPEIAPTGHAHVDPAFTLKEALLAPSYWILTLGGALMGLIGTGLIFHAQPMLEARGADPELSASIVRTWSLTMMAVIFPAGWLADRLAPRVLFTLSLVLLAISSAIPLLAGSAWVLHGSMLAFGLAQGFIAGVGPPTIARYFGRAHHGAIRASVTLFGVAGTGLGPIMLGMSFDRLGSFRPGLGVFVGMCVPLILGGMMLHRPKTPRRVSIVADEAG